MRTAHTVAEVRAAEAALMAELPEGALMARAATGLATAVADFLGSVYGTRILLLVGSGDNGGDALYAGAVLARRGAVVTALLLSPDRAHLRGVAALRDAFGRVVTDAADIRPAEFDVVVDGIVGIGASGQLRPDAASVVASLSGVPFVAVDVPSGVDVDTGQVEGAHVNADLTVTFGTHKVAHLVEPAASACGVVHLVDIGLDLPEGGVEALQADDVARALPVPAPSSHKYSRGVVGVRAGSSRYPGAGLLAVAGAATGFVGMVRYHGDVADQVRRSHPEVVSSEGRVNAWVVGPGGGPSVGEALKACLSDDVPLVIDADALALVTEPLDRPTVLTPHAGELAAMLGASRSDVEARQLYYARLAARELAAVVLLKGRHTIVAAPTGHARVTTVAPPWLATAGAGDVLAGLIGALLAAGLKAYDAASVGSWLHGAAATRASRGGPIQAGDVAKAIPGVARELLMLKGSSR